MTSHLVVAEIGKLVEHVLGGDQRAMVELVDRYRGRVYGLCYRMLGQREDAEDVVQETFIRVFDNLRRWDPKRNFEPWLLTIAANRCRTRPARRKPLTGHVLSLSPADHRWTRATEADQLQEELHLALTTLPANHARAFELFHQEQLSYAQIAKRLQVPEGTAKTWVHRARREIVRRFVARDVVEDRHAM